MFSPWQHRGVYVGTAQAKQLQWGTAGSGRGQKQGLRDTLEQGRFLQFSSCWVEQSAQTHPGLVTHTEASCPPRELTAQTGVGQQH